jgi:hypothetical protein
METISKKSKDMLYGVIDRKIMDARVAIRIACGKDNAMAERMDDIMYNLNNAAPKAAIDCFKE